MDIAQKYVEGLKQAYYSNNGGKDWEEFEETIHGAGKADIERLRAEFPDVPDSLVQLLEFVDGTYWRDYGGKEIAFFFLGSDLEEYPYYLLSVEQMLGDTGREMGWLWDYIDRVYEDLDVEIDGKIIDDSSKMHWLHFSDCMNNGGSSQLFLDFSPSPTGTKGQVVRYLHDPDEIEVIAESFDAYLGMVMERGYDFIGEEDMEEDMEAG